MCAMMQYGHHCALPLTGKAGDMVSRKIYRGRVVQLFRCGYDCVSELEGPSIRRRS